MKHGKRSLAVGFRAPSLFELNEPVEGKKPQVICFFLAATRCRARAVTLPETGKFIRRFEQQRVATLPELCQEYLLARLGFLEHLGEH